MLVRSDSVLEILEFRVVHCLIAQLGAILAIQVIQTIQAILVFLVILLVAALQEVNLGEVEVREIIVIESAVEFSDELDPKGD